MEEEKTIYEFDLALIGEYYSQLTRQGIGSPEMTIKALSFIDSLSQKSKIADLGCGTGGQTVVIAQNTGGNITAVDILPDFITIVNDNAKNLNLQTRIKGIVGSMDNPAFGSEELDLIWCEGAVYNIGFRRALNEWKKYLKKGGFIAISDASWITEERPSEIENYWTHHYPEITTVAENVDVMQKSGFIPFSVFIMPDNCWIDNYFIPQIPVQEFFLKKYRGNKAVEEFIDGCRREEKMYHEYKDFYGYVFYIGKKI